MPSTEGSNECSRPPDQKWHVLLLGRTFRDKSLQEAAVCLADVLDISLDEGLRKATSAMDGTTLVVSTCEICFDADAQAQQLRSKGLRVQVASDLGLPGLPKTPKCTSKSSYESIFRDAGHDRDPPPRRERRLSTFSGAASLDVPATVTQRRNKFSSQPSTGDAATARRNKFLSLPSSVPYGQESAQPPEDEDDSDKVVPIARLQASSLVRFLIFGIHCSPFQKLTRKGADTLAAEVQDVCQFFSRLGRDESDEIGHAAFKHSVDSALLNRYQDISQEKMETFPEWAKMSRSEKINLDFPRFNRRMREKISDHLFRGGSSFMLRDLLELTWPHASATSLESLSEKVLAAMQAEARAGTPPVLENMAYQELCAVFKDIDVDRRGEVSFSCLGDRGLIDKDSMVETRRAWDAAGNGFLDMAQFCEMMCPSGFRATGASRVAISQKGRKMILDPESMTWSWE